ncbi:hypothetical protein NIES4103_05740 [Nostoc sp. NIES-4103]|nr:hypothetical protein NIES4103_05740 [Nostoc sp. NIES-4103]
MLKISQTLIITLWALPTVIENGARYQVWMCANQSVAIIYKFGISTLWIYSKKIFPCSQSSVIREM